MPYSSTSRLPASVRNTLPKGAQTIYRKAFENAWEEYKSPNKRRGRTSREEVAHKVAWSAVKDKYQKNGEGKWSTRSGSSKPATVKPAARKSGPKSAAAETKQKSTRKSPAKTQTKVAVVKTKTATKAGGRTQQARWKAASARKAKATQGARGKTAASRGKTASAGTKRKPRSSRKSAVEPAQVANPGQQTQEHVISQQQPERAPLQQGDAGQAS